MRSEVSRSDVRAGAERDSPIATTGMPSMQHDLSHALFVTSPLRNDESASLWLRGRKAVRLTAKMLVFRSSCSRKS